MIDSNFVQEVSSLTLKSAFVPTQDELMQLVNYWTKKAIADEYFVFYGQCYGGSDLRRIDFAWNRVNEIAQVLGKEHTDEAVKKTHEETAQKFDPQSDWIVFRYGTVAEQTAYQDAGGQLLENFEPGVAEDMARKVMQRVLRDGEPEKQEALLKDRLIYYATKLNGYISGSRYIVEVSEVTFPVGVLPLLNTGICDNTLDLRRNWYFNALDFDRRKSFLTKLDEISNDESALKSLALKSVPEKNEEIPF
jgi:hypothetical protein